MFLILDLGANSSSILNNNILCETSSELITEQIRYVLYYITGCHVIVGVGSWQSNSMNIYRLRIHILRLVVRVQTTDIDIKKNHRREEEAS